MEARKMTRSLLASFVLVALVALAFVGVVGARSSPAEKDDVKKPDCVPGVVPRSFPGITPVPSHGGINPVPSHGGSSSGSDPSHGGGYGGSPSHGGLPSPSHGGSSGGLPSPSHGGGAYGGSPTPSQGGAYGGSPSHGAYGGSSPPALGGSPATTVDPHSPTATPGSCDYWRSHPTEIWSALGNRFPSMNIGNFFGTAGSSGALGGGGSSMSIQDALGNTRTDGAGALLREGAAALLNSMTRSGFPYSTDQVRDAFAAAAAGGSDGAAAEQAAAFKKANEGRA